MSLVGRMRVIRALQEAGLQSGAGPLERASGGTNEVWFAGSWVVRINTRPRRGNLRHESLVATLLPPGVGYPEVVGFGEDADAEWLVHRRAPGVTLSQVWHEMNEGARREATWQVADRLRLIHAVADVPEPAYIHEDTLECPHQLPPARTIQLFERARALPFVDRGVVTEAIGLIRANAHLIDADDSSSMVHGDLHFENILWDGDAISAVIDLEWARPGAPDLDLDVLLRFCAHPFLHVSRGFEHLARAEDYRLVPKWLNDAYPELFARPHLAERLVIYGLAYDVRDLLQTPPDGPLEDLSPFHPMRRIAATLRQRGYQRGLNI